MSDTPAHIKHNPKTKEFRPDWEITYTAASGDKTVLNAETIKDISPPVLEIILNEIILNEIVDDIKEQIRAGSSTFLYIDKGMKDDI